MPKLLPPIKKERLVTPKEPLPTHVRQIPLYTTTSHYRELISSVTGEIKIQYFCMPL